MSVDALFDFYNEKGTKLYIYNKITIFFQFFLKKPLPKSEFDGIITSGTYKYLVIL